MKNKLKIALLLSGIIGSTYGADQDIKSDENKSARTVSHTLHQSTQKPPLTTAPANILRTTNKEHDDISLSKAVSSLPDVETTVADTPLQEKIDTHAALIRDLEVRRHMLALSNQDSLRNAQPNPAQQHLNTIDIALWLLNLNYQLLVNISKHGGLLSETKNEFSVQNAASGRNQTRTPKSLKKEAQQNCLGKVIEVNFKGSAGAKQTVITHPSPSTIRTPKPRSREAIAADVEAKHATPMAPRSPIFESGISWEALVAEIDADKFSLPPAQSDRPTAEDL